MPPIQPIDEFVTAFVVHRRGANFRTTASINTLVKTLPKSKALQDEFCKTVSKKVSGKLGEPVSFSFPVDTLILSRIAAPAGVTVMLAYPPRFEWSIVFFIDKTGVRLR